MLKGFGGLKTYLQAWEIIVSKSKRKISSSSPGKTTSLLKPNQKLTEIVVSARRSEFNNNAKIVSKSFNKVIPWSHFNFIFSDG